MVSTLKGKKISALGANSFLLEKNGSEFSPLKVFVEPFFQKESSVQESEPEVTEIVILKNGKKLPDVFHPVNFIIFK